MSEKPHSDNSRLILAFVLIGIGIFWFLRRLGVSIDLPHIYWENIFVPVRRIFHGWGHFIFSWPMILIIIGLVLMAGKRSSGVVLIILGGIFILPRIFLFPGLSVAFLFPALLIGIGVAMIINKI